MSSWIRITFRNHTEDCCVYWFDKLRLLLSNYGELGSLLSFSDQVRWFGCVSFFECYVFVHYCWQWVANPNFWCFNEMGSLYLLCLFPVDDQQRLWFVFLVNDGIVRASSLTKVWGLAFFPVALLLTCIVKQGKRTRPCGVSMTTLLCPMKCKHKIGLDKFFITTKFLAKLRYPISNLSVTFLSWWHWFL